MRVPFVKMHGLGNDFVVLDARATDLPVLGKGSARAIADRHRGVGCDQIILLEPHATADFAMRIFNADGTEVEACGNASRAVALLHGEPAEIATAGGVVRVVPGDGGASVDMGKPRFDWDDIPLAYAMDTLALPVAWDELDNPAAANVGNPHIVFFVDDANAVLLEELGPRIETDPLFPRRINVNVAQLTGTNELRLRVWERGAGLTRACGTGACATAVSAMRRGLVARTVQVTLPGGPLTIVWNDDDRITMSGPATESFRGDFEWGELA
ncbi:diaminopimelate epimerase [Erythrobacter sp. LQ02-29]|uniref:diaminopimelate epimerase n=1 Tax=Erythrobacter sp. LQ02-29 TaxID=2920384 RepID=UPI001F4E201D|nr:diaminopimelate epimerase [Erythrobacter sp. LQ02-29]MCP9223579.1 diaminopimelate epimerase [Erythrobacter sp. LQ02-29]